MAPFPKLSLLALWRKSKIPYGTSTHAQARAAPVASATPTPPLPPRPQAPPPQPPSHQRRKATPRRTGVTIRLGSANDHATSTPHLTVYIVGRPSPVRIVNSDTWGLLNALFPNELWGEDDGASTECDVKHFISKSHFDKGGKHPAYGVAFLGHDDLYAVRAEYIARTIAVTQRARLRAQRGPTQAPPRSAAPFAPALPARPQRHKHDPTLALGLTQPAAFGNSTGRQATALSATVTRRWRLLQHALGQSHQLGPHGQRVARARSQRPP